MSSTMRMLTDIPSLYRNLFIGFFFFLTDIIKIHHFLKYNNCFS